MCALKEAKLKLSQHVLIIESQNQQLYYYNNGQLTSSHKISTSKYGLGEIITTKRTPRGFHIIEEKIGDDVPRMGIIKNRTYTGRIWQSIPREKHRLDHITSRVFRLKGLQPGLNAGYRNGKCVDSYKRMIYIHGTTMDWKLGQPSTIGCIHMDNSAIIRLYNQIPSGTLVWIN